MTDYISREEVLDYLLVIPIDLGYREIDDVQQFVENLPAADVVGVNDVAKMLTWLFADYCPCNYNGIDEWLPYTCEILDECPDPKDNMACWKQFVKHYKRRRDGDA